MRGITKSPIGEFNVGYVIAAAIPTGEMNGYAEYIVLGVDYVSGNCVTWRANWYPDPDDANDMRITFWAGNYFRNLGNDAYSERYGESEADRETFRTALYNMVQRAGINPETYKKFCESGKLEG
jgi:hypothetical protein